MDGLLRFSNTVRCDSKIEAWFSRDPFRLIVHPWFARMRDCGADVRERLHDGCLVACVGNLPFAYVNAFSAHAAICFFQGAALPIRPACWKAAASACATSNCAQDRQWTRAR